MSTNAERPLAGAPATPRGARGADRLPHQEAVERVIVQMRRQLAEGLALAEMAEIARLSPFHFLRVFRAMTGLTPRDFLAALRLQEAKRLLLTTGLSVTDVCFEVGYTSLGTFTTRFTRLVGVTPGQFRRMGERVVEACIRPLQVARAGQVSLAGPAGPARGGVAGRIDAPSAPAGLIFAALFPLSAPQGEPPACTVLPCGPGPYRIDPAPDGWFYVLACSVPWGDDPLGYLLPAEGVWVGVSRGPVQVKGGRAGSAVDIALRPIRPTDPPILPVCAFMLARRPELIADLSNPEEARRAMRHLRWS